MKLLRTAVLLFVALALCGWYPASNVTTSNVLVLGQSSAQVAALVDRAGGEVARELSIINGVEANVTNQQASYLQARGLQVVANSTITAASVNPTPGNGGPGNGGPGKGGPGNGGPGNGGPGNGGPGNGGPGNGGPGNGGSGNGGPGNGGPGNGGPGNGGPGNGGPGNGGPGNGGPGNGGPGNGGPGNGGPGNGGPGNGGPGNGGPGNGGPGNGGPGNGGPGNGGPGNTWPGIDPSSVLDLVPHPAHNLTGRNVTVAIVDSGINVAYRNGDLQQDGSLVIVNGKVVKKNGNGHGHGNGGVTPNSRFLVYRNFVANNNTLADKYGHGTHVAGIIGGELSSPQQWSNRWSGVAPEANLVVARALGQDGSGTYADAIAAIDWIVSNKNQYNIRVLNLSLFAPVVSQYWADPLNQAVMKAWKSGLVVVAAAGNNGPDARSIAVPGNNPYIITVGSVRSAAVSDSGNDELTLWSARGPTPDAGFVKPELLSPGVRIVAPLPNGSQLASTMAAGKVVDGVTVGIGGTSVSGGLYQLSGTSMSAAEVSGVIALLLQQKPNLTNNQVKWLLNRSSRVAVDASTGQASYSAWEQGFGKLDAKNLLTFNGSLGSANAGMDIARDLIPTAQGEHYIGLTRYDEVTGLYSIPASQDTTGTYYNWCGAYTPWPGSSALGSCATGGSTSPSAGSTWAGAGSVWAGAGSVWAGAGSVWAGAGSVWAGGGSVWAGAGSVWAGAGSVWAGAGSVWAGAGSVWAGAGSVWAGAGSVWAGLQPNWDGNP